MVSKPHRRHGCCHTKLPGRASVLLDLGPRRPDLAAGSPNGRASKEKGVGCGKPDSYRCRLGRGARRKVGEVLWLEDEGRRGRPAARRLAMASRFALVGLGLNKLGLVGKEKISVLRSARRRCCRPLTVALAQATIRAYAPPLACNGATLDSRPHAALVICQSSGTTCCYWDRLRS